MRFGPGLEVCAGSLAITPFFAPVIALLEGVASFDLRVLEACC
ncbi:MAG: hypothetical protein PSV35_00200 [bacterium]|nr:hypothetical protein [bacterium]